MAAAAPEPENLPQVCFPSFGNRIYEIQQNDGGLPLEGLPPQPTKNHESFEQVVARLETFKHHKLLWRKVLGVSNDATVEDTKIAFKRLAFVVHPDKNPGVDKEHLLTFYDLLFYV